MTSGEFSRTRAKLRAVWFVGVVAGWLFPCDSASADWNQWRGPGRDGIASGFKAPAKWVASSMEKQWTIAVGEGHSSPVVAGDRVYILTRENDREVMRCLALGDGQVLWQEAYDAPFEMDPPARFHGKGPKATPAVADGRVFALGIGGQLSAYDAKTGAVLWRKDFVGEFKSTSPLCGASASPLVDGSNVIAHVGGRDSGALTAFDAATGRVTWKWEGDGPGYASPVIATLGGIRQVITQSQRYCLGVSASDGRLRWKIPFTPSEQNIVTPVIAGELVILAKIQRPTVALAMSGAEPAIAWEAREITMHMCSPVVNGTTLFGLSDKQRGTLFAMNALSGEVLWKSAGRLGDNASLIDIGPAFLVVTTSGELVVLQRAGAQLQEIIRYNVADSPVWASPAVLDDRILIKDRTSLTLFKIVERE